MRLAQNDDVIQTLTSDRSDNPFGKAILPGRRWCNWLVSDAHGAKSACDNGGVDPSAVPDHITRSSIPRKCHGDLAWNPLPYRVGCNVDPYEISAMKPDDDKPYSSLKPMVGTGTNPMRYSWIDRDSPAGRDHAACASTQSPDVEVLRSQLQAATSTRTKQNSPNIRQLRQFHHVINSDKVFDTHKTSRRPPRTRCSEVQLSSFRLTRSKSSRAAVANAYSE
jgi:hypothetical protein